MIDSSVTEAKPTFNAHHVLRSSHFGAYRTVATTLRWLGLLYRVEKVPKPSFGLEHHVLGNRDARSLTKRLDLSMKHQPMIQNFDLKQPDIRFTIPNLCRQAMSPTHIDTSDVFETRIDTRATSLLRPRTVAFTIFEKTDMAAHPLICVRWAQTGHSSICSHH